jgi:hypothetical protein
MQPDGIASGSTSGSRKNRGRTMSVTSFVIIPLSCGLGSPVFGIKCGKVNGIIVDGCFKKKCFQDESFIIQETKCTGTACKNRAMNKE